MTVHVAFRHYTGRSVWSRLIHVVAGPPVHCALVTWSAEAQAYLGFHAVAGVGVERFTLTAAERARERWSLEPVPAADALRALAFCQRRVGSAYDYVGAVLFGTPFTTRDRWTCSELCAEALVEAGAPLALLDAGRTPRRLLRALRGGR